jgi:2-oxoglutarate ferredoxin oxidoreductase subunit delta
MAIYLDEKMCKGCGLCIYYCPKNVLRMSDRRNEKGYNVVEVCNLENCNACKMCEINCPDFVIYVEKEAASSHQS